MSHPRDNVFAGRSIRSGAANIDTIKRNVHHRLLEIIDLNAARTLSPDRLFEECRQRVDILLNEQQCPLSNPEKEQLLREVMDEIFGLGPLETMIRDESISDILVNGPNQIYIERHGVLEKTDAYFRDSEQLLRVIQRIASRIGRRIDESSPMLDARLEDGSRVNAIIPPLSLIGPVVSIRRFGTVPFDMERLMQMESFTSEIASFLDACVWCKQNVLVSGGTGTGKTTLLNMLSKWIPEGERVVTIEDAAELQMQREHVVRLETRPPNIEGKGEITQRDLVRNSLRMRPDRIIVGEVRGAEALDMLQAMNTGHEGSMTTVHANTPRDALHRIENMVSMAGLNFPVRAIRQQVSSAINILVHLDRMTGGRRKIVRVAEISGMEGDMILLQDIFQFHQKGVGPDGHAYGQFESCGVRPKVVERLEAEGITFGQDFFSRRVLTSNAGNGKVTWRNR